VLYEIKWDRNFTFSTANLNDDNYWFTQPAYVIIQMLYLSNTLFIQNYITSISFLGVFIFIFTKEIQSILYIWFQ
jgi:hypothetical protein